MRSLLVICILIGLAAVAAPKLVASYLHQPTTANVVSETASAEEEGQAAPPSGARQVEIKAEGDGHFYVNAEINSGHGIRLMVDTGASVVALRASDAAAAGIRPLKSDFSEPVQTANGTTMAAEATIDRISVEDIEIHHVRALVLSDDQLSLSLLGASFLKGLQRYQVADGRLLFEN
jgi:aspartyl protease family protein